MKILFFDIRSQREQNMYSFPISALHIISLIRTKYPDIEYDIFEYFPQSKKEIKEIIIKKKYDVFLFSTYLWNSDTNFRIIKEINKLNYGKIIIGGRNINFFEEFTLEHLKTFNQVKIDFFVRGPAESNIIEIFDYFNGIGDVSEIKNIVYFKDNKYYKNFCDKKSNFSYFSYYNKNQDIVDYLLKNKKNVNVEYSYEFLKGCPFKCSFCAYSNESNSNDFNNYDLVKNDLFYLIKKTKSFGINRIFFFILDANFGIDHQYYFKILRFLNVLKRLFKVDIKLIISIYKNINKDSIYLMNYLVEKDFYDKYYFAIQTFSEDVLKANKRKFNHNLESDIKEIIKHKPYSEFNFELVLGLYKQTKKHFINDLITLHTLGQKLNIKMNIIVYNLYIFPDIEIKKMFLFKETNLIKNTIYYLGKDKRNKYFENEKKEILVSNNYINKYQLLSVRNFLIFYLFFNDLFSKIKNDFTFNDLTNFYCKFFIKNKIIKKRLNFLMKDIFWNSDKRKDHKNSEEIVFIYHQIYLIFCNDFNYQVNKNALKDISSCFMTLIPIKRNRIYYINKRKIIIENLLKFNS